MLSSRRGWELWNIQVPPGWGGDSVCSRFLICSRNTFIKKLQLSVTINPQKAFTPNLFYGRKKNVEAEPGIFFFSLQKISRECFTVVFGPSSHPYTSILIFLCLYFILHLYFWHQQRGQSVPAESFVNYYIFLIFPLFSWIKRRIFSSWSHSTPQTILQPFPEGFLVLLTPFWDGKAKPALVFEMWAHHGGCSPGTQKFPQNREKQIIELLLSFTAGPVGSGNGFYL